MYSISGTLAAEFNANDLVQSENISCKNRSDIGRGKLNDSIYMNEFPLIVVFSIDQIEWVRISPRSRGFCDDVQVAADESICQYTTICPYNARRWRFGGERSKANTHHQGEQCNRGRSMETAWRLR